MPQVGLSKTLLPLDSGWVRRELLAVSIEDRRGGMEHGLPDGDGRRDVGVVPFALLRCDRDLLCGRTVVIARKGANRAPAVQRGGIFEIAAHSRRLDGRYCVRLKSVRRRASDPARTDRQAGHRRYSVPDRLRSIFVKTRTFYFSDKIYTSIDI